MLVDRLPSLCLVIAWNKNKEEVLNKTKQKCLQNSGVGSLIVHQHD